MRREGMTVREAAEDWVLEMNAIQQGILVPEGVYVVEVGKHPLVLRPVDAKPEDIRPEYRYFHYLICGKVYAGVFVGRETDG